MTAIYARGRKYNVVATLDDDFSVVLKKGGVISLNEGKSLSGKIIRLRKDFELVDAEGKLLRDISFKSVSTAASFVTGTMSNGFKIWRYQKNGELISQKES